MSSQIQQKITLLKKVDACVLELESQRGKEDVSGWWKINTNQKGNANLELYDRPQCLLIRFITSTSTNNPMLMLLFLSLSSQLYDIQKQVSWAPTKYEKIEKQKHIDTSTVLSPNNIVK